MTIKLAKLLSGRVSVVAPTEVAADRYQFLSVAQAEPNLGTGINGSVLTTDINGTRIWANAISISSISLTGNLSAGNINVANKIVGGSIYSNSYFYANGTPFTSSNYGNTEVAAYIKIDPTITGTQANLGAYQIYANSNIGTLTTSLSTLQANVGAYQTYANANAATQATAISSLATNANANTAAYLTGNITTGNIAANGSITATGVVTATSFVGSFAGTGTGGSITGANVISANTFVASGNITGVNYLYPNGVSILSGIGGTYSNANVASYLPTHSGNISAGNVTATGVVTATSFVGSFAGTGTGGSITGANVISANTFVFYGNGVNILTAATGTYSNANVTAYLPTDTTITGIQANLGAYQTYANTRTQTLDANLGTATTNIAGINANLGAYQTYANANATTQATAITSLATGANANTAAYLTTSTGNISAGNITANGNVTANYVIGNFVGAFTSTGTGGNISGAQSISANTLAATGNVTAGNVLSNNYLYPNGVSILSGIGGTYSNTNVAAYLSSNTITGNISTTGNITTTANVTANYVIGNFVGAFTSTGTGGNISGAQSISANTLTATGNVIGANFTFANGVNILSTASTEITNLWANAATQANQLAAANAAAISYTDTAITNLINMAPAALDTLGEIAANIAEDAGAVSAIINSITNTNANVTAANIAISSLATGANANTAAYLTGNITAGNITANNITSSGNITAPYFIGAFQSSGTGGGNISGANVISANTFVGSTYTYPNGVSILSGIGGTYSNANVASYLPTYSGNIGAGNIAATGNITANNITANNITSSGNITAPYFIGAFQSSGTGGGNITGANVISANTFVFNSNGVSIISAAPGTYSNANVTAYLPIDTTITGIQANIGAYQIYANANATAQATAITSLATGANANTAAYLLGNITTGNITTTGVVTAASFSGAFTGTGTGGNITGANFMAANTFVFNGNGVNILSAAPGTYSNANVTAYLPTDSTITGIQANLGAYQTYANANAATQATAITSLATGANANTAAYLSSNTITGNIATTGNISTTGNVTAAYVIGNFVGSGTGGSITGATLISATTLTATGNVTAGNVLAASYLYANGVSILTGIGGTYSNTNVAAYLTGNITTGNIATAGSITANGNVTANYVIGNFVGSGTGGSITGATLISANTITATGNVTGAAFTFANGVNILSTVGGTYSNANVAAYLTTATGNISADSITTTGALVVGGNLTVLGNVTSVNTEVVNSIEYVQTTIATNVFAANIGNVGAQGTFGNIITTDGLFWANGVSALAIPSTYSNANVTSYLPTHTGNISADNITATGNITGGGVRSTTGNTAPANPTVGDMWYDTSIDTLFRYTYDGTSAYWFDLFSSSTPTNTFANLVVTSNVASTSTTTGALTVDGGAGITGNVVVGGVYSSGYFYANGVPFSSSNYGNTDVAAYLPTDSTITGIQANLGAYQIYANANAATQATAITSLATGANANTAAYLLGNITTGNITANGVVTATSFVGSFAGTGTGGTIAGANTIAANTFIFNSNGVNILSTVTGTYSNANVTAYLPTDSTITGIQANLGAYQTYANANAATQATAITSLATGANTNTAAYLAGNVTTGNITSTGSINSTGNVTAPYFVGNLVGTGSGGSLTGANLLSAAYVTVTANVQTANIISTNYLYPNGVSILSGIGGTYSNANVAAYLTSNTITGNIAATGNITASYFVGNLVGTGSGGSLTGANLLSASYVTVTSNVQTANLNVSANAVIGNVLAASYLYANGVSILSGIGSTYSNTNVAAYLTSNTITGNIATTGNISTTGSISTTGNVTASYFIGGFVGTSTGGSITGANVLAANTFIFNSNGVNILSTVTGTYSNANVTAYLPTDTTITGIQANLGAYQIYANANAATQATAITSLATSANANTAAYLLNNNITVGANLTVSGNLIVVGNSYVLQTEILTQNEVITGNIYAGAYFFANGTPFASSNFGNADVSALLTSYTGNILAGNVTVTGNITGGGIRSTTSATPPTNPTVGDMWYDTTSDTLFRYTYDGTSAYWFDLFSSSTPTNVFGNLVANSGVDSTSTTTGALIVWGGAGVTGNVTAGNVYSTGYFYANGTPFTSGGAGGSISTAGATAPTSPAVGDFWYKTTTDILYRYTYDGANYFWVDLITSPSAFGNLSANSGVASTSTTTGALVVWGGAGVTGNVTAGNVYSSGYFYANGAPFTSSSYGNTEVAAYLPTNTTITSIQANVGAYQTYANANAATQATAITSLATNANANTAAYLLGNVTTGNITANGNVTANYFVGAFTGTGTGGTIAGANTIAANTFIFNSNGVNILSTVTGTYSNANVTAYLPTDSTITGIQANLGAYQTYANANAATQATAITSLATGANTNTAAYLSGNIITGNITTTGNIATTANVSANYFNGTFVGAISATGTGGNISGANVITANSFVTTNGIFWANGTNALAASYGNTQVTAYLPTDSTITGIQANLGAYQIYANANAATQATAISSLTTGANATTAAYLLNNNITVGANLTVAGNLIVVGNSYVLQTEILTQNEVITGNIYAGAYFFANGTPFTSGGAGGSISTAGATAPTSPAVGDFWYNTTTDILYRYTYDGASNNWLDIISSPNSFGNLTANSGIASTSTTTGTFVVYGGAGVTGNVVANRLYTTEGLFWSNGTAFSSGGFSGNAPTTGSTPPSTPTVSDTWYNTDNDTLYRWTFDGTSNYWLDISGSSISTAASEEPLHPFLLMGA